MKCQFKCSITIYSAGSACLFVGLLMTAFWWDLYNDIVLKRLPLSNDSESFQLWTGTEIPIYFRVYPFNWTNPEASLARREKPKVQQVGPYVYRLEIYRKEFVWNNNDTLTYSTGQRFFFVPELSRGDPTVDTIITPNIILLTLFDHFSSLPKIVQWSTDVTARVVDKLLRRKAYVKRKVSDLLFDGFSDIFLDTLKYPKKGLEYAIPSLRNIPDRFYGYFPKKNGSMEYVLNMHTGQTDLRKMGFIHTYNYSTSSPVFKGPCGRVNRSSPGDFWPVDTTTNEHASLFIPDFCSSFQMKNLGEYNVNGVEGVRFAGTEITFDNGTLDPEKRCYCRDKEYSLKSGLRDVSSCVHAPIFISFPHFYAADSSYLDQVNGLNPDKKLHAFHITLQKDYGVLLNGDVRLQINTPINFVPEHAILGHKPDFYLPILWFETSINLPPAMADKIHLSFTTAPLVLNIIGPLLLVLGLVTLVMNFFHR